MAEIRFTPSQRAAIETPCGPILVSAAAGSGKTMVLVQRLMARICDPDDPCSIDDFLIITYTKKAASELRTKISEELSARLSAQPENQHLQRQLSRIYLAKISTIHSFCGELLREHAYRLDIPADFRIAEQDECALLRANVVAELLEERYRHIGEDADLRTLVDSLGAGRNDRSIEQLIVNVYLTSQCHPYPLEWLTECVRGLEVSDLSGAEQTVWGRFLMDSFRELLDKQEELLRPMLQRILQMPPLDKYAGVYQEALELIARLKAASTWDALYEAVQTLKFSSLPIVRKCPQPELQEQVKALRNSCKDAIKDYVPRFYAPSETVFADLGQTASAMRGLLSLVRDFSDAYGREKLRMHALDYNDLEHGAIRLLLHRSDGTPTQTAKELSARFREIMIDEYQDTNEVQDRIFAAISRGGKNRFMVGDVKQSIYRFRLADPTIFLEKYANYAPHETAEPGQARKILLTENFRSEAPILEAVNAVFRANMSTQVGGLDYGDREALRKGVPSDEPAPPVELHCISTCTKPGEQNIPKERTEAAFIAKRIRALLNEPPEGDARPLEPRDVVILLRSVKQTAEVYLEELRRLGIPCEGDREESFFSSEEIEVMISFLQVLDNAHQDIPLASVLLSPVFAVSAETLARAKLLATDRDLADAVRAAAASEPQLAKAVDTIGRLREQAARLSLHTLLEQINEETGFEAIYACLPDGAARVQRLRRFAALASSFEDGGRKSLHQFLLRLNSWQQRGLEAVQESSLNTVKVTTIHKTKGLEFPVVFLANLSKGFNTESLGAPVLFDEQLGVGTMVYQKRPHASYPSIAWLAIAQRQAWEQLSEELRVLYVGMTRPRQRLIMTCCGARLNSRLKKIAAGLTVPLEPFFVRQQTCMGDWVLSAALLRTEAGALFAVADHTTPASVQDSPWIIRYEEATAPPDASPAPPQVTQAQSAPPEPKRLAEALRFRYPFAAAAQTPSKITATQLKGRMLDEEAADRRVQSAPVKLTKPLLQHAQKPLTPAQKGTAMHLAMQYLDFSRTDSPEQIAEELQRLTEEKFLSPQQAEAVSPEKIYVIFAGPVGVLIRQADRVIREFKFSLLSDASDYCRGVEGEKLMLQGVTDCCLIKDGKITVIDFKTDRLQPGQEAHAAEKYRPQLEAYSSALSRIFALPVTEKLLYFFSTDTAISL